MNKYNKLISFVKTTGALKQASGLIAWDQETMMPSGSSLQRAECLSALEEMIHLRLIDPKLEELISSINTNELNYIQLSNIKHIKKTCKKLKKIPVKLAKELALKTSLSQHAWIEARRKNNAIEFYPFLDDVISLKRAEAECLSTNGNLYDGLIDNFEPNIDSDNLKSIFSKLKEKIISIRSKVFSDNKSDFKFKNTFNKTIQLQLAYELAHIFGFNKNIGRIDLSEHPFSSGEGDDVRITTRISNNNPFNCIYSIIHETGHAVYEQNIPKDYIFTPNGHGISMGVHESQSRLFENQFGRSREFCTWLHKRMNSYFKDFEIKNSEHLYEVVNKVDQNFIRTEADELQYNLHIMMRFDLEIEIINGRAKSKEIEGLWNEKFYKDFGMIVDCPNNGFLQDIHWPAGLFGYFPTYCLGNIYAACLYEEMLKELPKMMFDLKNGDTEKARNWLIKNIYLHASTNEPEIIIKNAIGRNPTEKPLSNYLNKKFNSLV